MKIPLAFQKIKESGMKNNMKWKMAATHIVGLGHIKNNVVCQDRTYSLEFNDTNCVALSDGAGSCPLSHIGAKEASRSACIKVIRDFDHIYSENIEAAKHDIVKRIVSNVCRRAEKKKKKFKDLSATLLFVAVKGDRFIAGHIGDGIIGALKKDKVEPLSLPDNGEYINSTYFITHDDPSRHFHLIKGKVEDINGFILMSDGSAESLFDRKTAEFSKAAVAMISWLEDNDALEVKKALAHNIETVIRKKTQDDCSIGILKLVSHVGSPTEMRANADKTPTLSKRMMKLLIPWYKNNQKHL